MKNGVVPEGDKEGVCLGDLELLDITRPARDDPDSADEEEDSEAEVQEHGEVEERLLFLHGWMWM